MPEHLLLLWRQGIFGWKPLRIPVWAWHTWASVDSKKR